MFASSLSSLLLSLSLLLSSSYFTFSMQFPTFTYLPLVPFLLQYVHLTHCNLLHALLLTFCTAIYLRFSWNPSLHFQYLSSAVDLLHPHLRRLIARLRRSCVLWTIGSHGEPGSVATQCDWIGAKEGYKIIDDRVAVATADAEHARKRVSAASANVDPSTDVSAAAAVISEPPRYSQWLPPSRSCSRDLRVRCCLHDVRGAIPNIQIADASSRNFVRPHCRRQGLR